MREKSALPLDLLFKPRGVAVVGASRSPEKVGHAVVKNLLDGGRGRIKVYPVNPKAEEILGLRCYPSVLEVEGEVDLAVVVVPAPAVPSVIEECGQRGIRFAIVISAGFKEAGPEGAERERQLKEVAKRAGVRIVGPNCLGILTPTYGLNASFAPFMPPPGNIALISQSGALLDALLDWSLNERIGFSKVVSFGNRADLDESDFVAYLGDDEETRVILCYLESIEDGRKFVEVASEAARKKPILVIKAGVSERGARAASSHTGSLAGSAAAYQAAFKQAGVIQAGSVEELFSLAEAFSRQPPPKGRRIAVVTNAGGPGVLATDAAEREGLEMAQFEPETIRRLRESLPPTAAVTNPVDVIGDATSERYRKAIEVVERDPNVDAICVILTPQAMTDTENIARVICDLSSRSEKPFVASFMGGEKVEEGRRILSEGGIPEYPFPEQAIKALGGMARWREFTERPPLEPPHFEDFDREGIEQLLERAGRRSLVEVEALDIVAKCGIRVPRKFLARTPEEAVEAAKEIGFPVVMKIASPDILHKTDVGGVRVGLTTEEEVLYTFEGMVARARRLVPGAEIWGVTVEEMVRGREVILGMSEDPQFGPLIMLGLGGVYVEVLKDVSFRLAPVDEREVREMLSELRGHPLLRGVRGEPAGDIDALVEAVLRFSKLVTSFPQIAEAEINPLMVLPHGEGVVAVDARIVLKGREKEV